MKKFSACFLFSFFLFTTLNAQSLASDDSVIFEGIVFDDFGTPLPGVDIKITSSSKGTTTDLKGEFKLELPKGRNSTIIFSYIGMQTQTYVFKGESSFVKIVLKEDVSELDEVVVIGYGKKSRYSVTSSISSINSDDIERSSQGGNTIDNMLGGAVKGVLIRKSSGEPGSSASINIRGITSPFPNLSSYQENNIPLFIIDGVPTFVGSNELNPLSAIAPDDIESIDILKDAAATAIYGSRGANGVIIINTISGKKNRPVSVNVKYSFSVSNPIKQYTPLNREQFMSLQDEIIRNTVDAANNFEVDLFSYQGAIGSLANLEMDPATGQFIYKGLKKDAFGSYNTNWEKEVQNENAPTQELYTSITGGSDKADYALSLNVLDQEGLLINDKLNRYNFRMALGLDISKSISIGANGSYTYSKRNSGSESHEFRNDLSPTWSIRPDVPVYTEGKFSRIEAAALQGPGYSMPNPVAKKQIDAKSINKQLSGNAYIDIKLAKNLKLHSDINFSNYEYANNYFTPIISSDYFPYLPKVDRLSTSNSSVFRSSGNIRLDYGITAGKHKLDMMTGVSRDYSKNESTNYFFEGFPNGKKISNIGSAQKLLSYSDSSVEDALSSIYGRFSYNYDRKYLVEVSMRGDKSSKFGVNNRWGYFPAISTGWAINRENFMADVTFVDDLKLRFSLGQTGSTNIPDFSYTQHFISGGNNFYGDLPYVGLEDVLPNEDVRWEVTTEVNTGIDFSLLSNRIYGSVDVYYRYTDGALAPAPHLSESGLSKYYANIIDTSNKGIELQIGGYIAKGDNFIWSSDFNISFNRNRIEKLNSASIDSYLQDSFIEGYPAGTAKGYVVKKIIQDPSEIEEINAEAVAKGHLYYQPSIGVGDYLMVDTNKDGHITPDDRQVITSPEANFFGGWSNTFKYKNISLNISCQFLKGGDILWSPVRNSLGSTVGFSVIPEIYGNTWTPERTDAEYPRLVGFLYNYNVYDNDRFVFNSSYFRIKNIVLEYNLPEDISTMLRVNDLSVSLSASNLLTFSKWPGLDPETTGASVTSKSFNSDTYPTGKSLTLGVKASF